MVNSVRKRSDERRDAVVGRGGSMLDGTPNPGGSEQWTLKNEHQRRVIIEAIRSPADVGSCSVDNLIERSLGVQSPC